MTVDTIAALGTAGGSAPRGVVRLSGPRAIEIAARCFQPDPPHSFARVPGHSRLSGRLMLGAAGSVAAATWLFRAPHSATREEIVELHIPGGPGLASLLLDRLLTSGARAAEPGEFTARAVRNGAMDLCQAEAVAERLYARSDAQLRAAQRLLRGDLARAAGAARETLADLRALVEAALDFAEEDMEFIAPQELRARLAAVAAGLRETAGARERGERLAEPPLIALAGPPNAGKSTLLNRLTGLERALCSPIAGSTRDVLVAPLRLPRGEVLLCDTAGVTDSTWDVSANREMTDAATPHASRAGIARQAAEATRRAIEEASLVIWVSPLDAPRSPPKELSQQCAGRLIIVHNKCDLGSGVDPSASPPGTAPVQAEGKSSHSPTAASDRRSAADSRAAPIDSPGGMAALLISAARGDGCDALLRLLDERLNESGCDAGDSVLLSAELRRVLEEATACLERAGDLARSGAASAAELIAAELHAAGGLLGRLTGETDAEDLYDRIFSRFCIGK